ncbi:long-chain fatty acid--CoA ligase [Candidatus Dependentiae bacterium]|nr:long-chain fatty acid--CoA ligase [Candidatus Dependentiae bacterium]
MGLSEQTLFENIQKACMPNRAPLFAGRLLQRAYHNFASSLALIAPSQRITYKDLYFRALLMSRKLAAQGVQKHDRVMILYENSPAFYIAYFGAWQLGAVCVPVNTFLHERELAYIVDDAKPSVVIVSRTLKPLVDSVLSARSSIPSEAPFDELTMNDKLDQEKKKHATPIILSEEAFDWHTPTPENPEAACNDVTLQELEPDELCVLLYTSGTTGTPKGVMLSSRNVMTNVMQCFARFTIAGLAQDERFFCVLPLFHVFAQNVCLWLPALIGACVILVQKIDRKLILEGLQERPTIFFGVPPLYGLLCLMKTAPLTSVKIFVSGADMLPDKIRAAFAIIYGRKICTGYGLSEASPVVAFNLSNNNAATYVVGETLQGITCQIRDENGSVLAVNTVGTLWIKGNNIMMGYYNSSEATAVILQDGWLNTGDLGSVDLHGNLAIRGRIKDIIIHKGFNIYPAEIENVLMMHPMVFKAAVIGQEEEMAGQVPIAFVAVRNREPNMDQLLRKHCTNNLATYKVPRKIVCLDDLPMNATGKIDKKQLFTMNE